MLEKSLQRKNTEVGKKDGLIHSEVSISEIPMWQLPGKGKVTTSSLSKVVTRVTEVNGVPTKVRIKVSPSAEWGYPTVLDLEYFRAFERALTMIWQREGLVPDVLRISGRELIRLTGKAPNGDRHKEVRDFIERMSGLQLVEHSIGKRGKVNQGVHIFERFDQESRDVREGGEQWAHQIVLADWYWANLNNFHCHIQDQRVFLALRRDLSKLLYQHLHALFRIGRGAANELYSEFATNMSLKRLRAISEVRRQIGPAHEELLHVGFIGNWSIEPGEDKGDYRLLWEAGPTWNEVYQTEQQMVRAIERAPRREEMLLEGETASDPTVTEAEDEDMALEEIYDFVGRHDRAYAPFWKKVIASFSRPIRHRVIGEVRELALSRQIRTTRARALVAAFQREGKRLGLDGWNPKRAVLTGK